MEGTPEEQAKKIVQFLQVGARTIASLSGVEYKRIAEGGAASSKPPEPAEPPAKRGEGEKPAAKKTLDSRCQDE